MNIHWVNSSCTINCAFQRAFVRITATCRLEEMWIGLISLAYNFSLTTWQSISMCLVRSWNTEFSAICRANWLLQKSKAGREWSIFRSASEYFSHMTSQVVEARALYSTSTEDLETMDCFFDFQDIKLWSKNMQYPVIDFLVSLQSPQTESQNPLMCNSKSIEKNKTCPGECLIYLSTL